MGRNSGVRADKGGVDACSTASGETQRAEMSELGLRFTLPSGEELNNAKDQWKQFSVSARSQYHRAWSWHEWSQSSVALAVQ